MDNINKPKKAWYKRVWVWIIVVIVLLAIAGASSSKQQASTSSNAPATQAQQAPKWNLEDAYAKVQDGMTKGQVEAATGKTSDNCTESQDAYFGKTEICSYGNAFTDKGTITVTYHQDAVSSKTKTTY